MLVADGQPSFALGLHQELPSFTLCFPSNYTRVGFSTATSPPAMIQLLSVQIFHPRQERLKVHRRWSRLVRPQASPPGLEG